MIYVNYIFFYFFCFDFWEEIRDTLILIILSPLDPHCNQVSWDEYHRSEILESSLTSQIASWTTDISLHRDPHANKIKLLLLRVCF